MTIALDYQEFKSKAQNGDLLVGVEPSKARRFFTDNSRELIYQEIGNDLMFARILIMTIWLLIYVSILACVIASIFALKWLSIILIPIIILGCLMLMSQASVGRQTISGAIILIFISLIIANVYKESNYALALLIALLPLPYFFARLTYKLATSILRKLSIKNERAYNLLIGTVIFSQEVP